jgi:hypothetical protein
VRFEKSPLTIIFVSPKTKDVSKDTNFIGQPIFSQLLKFINKSKIDRIALKHNADRYTKKFTTYNHLVVMLYAIFEGVSSLREVVIGVLANSSKIIHLGLNSMPKRSTLSDANKRRSSKVFEDIYMKLYQENRRFLSDSRASKLNLKRLFMIDSTTISLFKAILKAVGRKPLNGKKKGGIKAHVMINAQENTPILVRYSSAARHDKNFLKHIDLAKGSIIVFDRAYNDYKQYARFTSDEIFFVTREKKSAVFQQGKVFKILDNTDSGVVKDEEIFLTYREDKKQLKLRTRRITYYEEKSRKTLIFITNNFELDAETIAAIYKKRWQIETLFKQLKQNFPLKYFLGDNQNAIEIQIWVSMIANLLVTLIKNRIKRKWAFSNLVSLIRMHLMNYINIYKFLEDPEKSWKNLLKKRKNEYKYSLFPT